MYKVIDIIEKTIPKTRGVYVKDKYIGHSCVIMKKSDLEIKGKNITIKDPSKGDKARVKPHNPSSGRIIAPTKYIGEEVIIFIQDEF